MEEAREQRRLLLSGRALTAVGLAAVAGGSERVTLGAERLVVAVGVPALLMGMVVNPAAI